MTKEEAIMVLKNEQPHCGEKALFSEEKKYEAYDVAIKALEQEPKTGHWIEVTNGRGGHECDVCHNYAPSFQDGDEYLSAFCPNCGADMRVTRESKQPFINKPCVSEGVCREDKIQVLDKIRAEIEQGYCTVNDDFDHGCNYGLYMATQIIDKYKEGEE